MNIFRAISVWNKARNQANDEGVLMYGDVFSMGSRLDNVVLLLEKECPSFSGQKAKEGCYDYLLGEDRIVISISAKRLEFLDFAAQRGMLDTRLIASIDDSLMNIFMSAYVEDCCSWVKEELINKKDSHQILIPSADDAIYEYEKEYIPFDNDKRTADPLSLIKGSIQSLEEQVRMMLDGPEMDDIRSQLQGKVDEITRRIDLLHGSDLGKWDCVLEPNEASYDVYLEVRNRIEQGTDQDNSELVGKYRVSLDGDLSRSCAAMSAVNVFMECYGITQNSFSFVVTDAITGDVITPLSQDYFDVLSEGTICRIEDEAMFARLLKEGGE